MRATELLVHLHELYGNHYDYSSGFMCNILSTFFLLFVMFSFFWYCWLFYPDVVYTIWNIVLFLLFFQIFRVFIIIVIIVIIIIYKPLAPVLPMYIFSPNKTNEQTYKYFFLLDLITYLFFHFLCFMLCRVFKHNL